MKRFALVFLILFSFKCSFSQNKSDSTVYWMAELAATSYDNDFVSTLDDLNSSKLLYIEGEKQYSIKYYILNNTTRKTCDYDYTSLVATPNLNLLLSIALAPCRFPNCDLVEVCIFERSSGNAKFIEHGYYSKKKLETADNQYLELIEMESNYILVIKDRILLYGFVSPHYPGKFQLTGTY